MTARMFVVVGDGGKCSHTSYLNLKKQLLMSSHMCLCLPGGRTACRSVGGSVHLFDSFLVCTHF